MAVFGVIGQFIWPHLPAPAPDAGAEQFRRDNYAEADHQAWIAENEMVGSMSSASTFETVVAGGEASNLLPPSSRSQDPGHKVFNNSKYRSHGTGKTSEVWGESYGAKGDYDANTGIGTDNTRSLQAWLNACGVGYDARLAGGVYMISSPLKLPANAHFMSIDFGGGAVVMTNRHRVSAIFCLTNNALLDVTFSHGALIADTSALYTVFAQGQISPPGLSSMAALHFEDMYFYGGVNACVRIGDYSETGRDIDSSSTVFRRCAFKIQGDAAGLILDAPNAVPIAVEACSFGGYNGNTGALPAAAIMAVSGKSLKVDGCFFGAVRAGRNWCVNVGPRFQGASIDACDFEETRTLYVAARSANEDIVSLCNTSTSTARSGCYSVWAEGGTIRLDNCYLCGSDPGTVDVYVAGALTANNVILGEAGQYVLTRPSRCTINGVRVTDVKPVNSNSQMTKWSGLSRPADYNISPHGEVLVTQIDNSSASSGYQYSRSRWTAGITVKSGADATSHTFSDGLANVVDWQSLGMPSGVTLVAFGHASSPQICLQLLSEDANGRLSGSARAIHPMNANGFWFGALSLPPDPSATRNVRLHANIGAGSGSLKDVSIDIVNFSLLLIGSDDAYNGQRWDYPFLGAVVSAPWQPIRNNTFDATNGWTMTGWTLEHGAARHLVGNTNVLAYLGLPPAIQRRRIWVSFDLNGTPGTTGTIACSVAGAVVRTPTANSEGNHTYHANVLNGSGTSTEPTEQGIVFTPSSDFDGSIDNVYLYVAPNGGGRPD